MRYLAILTILVSSIAWAQEPTFMEAATHPGSEALYQRLLWTSPTLKDGSTREQLWELKSSYGFSPVFAAKLDLENDGDGWRYGSLRVMQRVIQRDTGPIDTWRASVHGGIEWVDGRDPGPHIGFVSTTIRGRHGFNGQLEWHGGERSTERFEANASHLYRIAPAQYRPETRGAWYTMLESLNTFAGDGTHAGDVAVGLLYEARRWAAEVSVLAQEPNEQIGRRSTRIGIGYRYLW